MYSSEYFVRTEEHQYNLVSVSLQLNTFHMAVQENYWSSRRYNITVQMSIVLECSLIIDPRERYTECPGRNVKNFGRVFLMLKYTDITQNTYTQSWTVTEIMAREKYGFLWGRRTVAASWQPQHARPSVWYRITSRALFLTCIPSVW
jgi:hypothetical protein